MSLRLHLALVFMAGSLMVLMLVTGFRSWMFVHEIRSRNEAELEDHMAGVAGILAHRPADSKGLMEQIIGEDALTLDPKIWLRVADDLGVLGETPGMSRQLPFPWPVGRRTVFHDGHRYLVAEVRDGRHRIQGALEITEGELRILDDRQQMILSLAGGAVICALFGWAAAHRGLQPLGAIAEATRRISPYPLRERLDTGRLPPELRELVQALNAMLDRIDQAFDRLTQFSAELAHEFRTPITILMGEAEIVLARDRAGEEYRQVVESSLEEYRRLSRLISRMLFLARADHPQAATPVEPVQMDGLVRQVLAFFEAVAEEQGVALEAEVTGSLRVDADMLRQALGNLVSNALEATPAGGSVRVAAGRHGPDWVVTVRDTGRGIAPEDLPYVRDRFYRSRTVDPKRRGTGLGLAIVDSIARLHGGTMRIESGLGLGTTVTLSFPAERRFSDRGMPLADRPGTGG